MTHHTIKNRILLLGLLPSLLLCLLLGWCITLLYTHQLDSLAQKQAVVVNTLLADTTAFHLENNGTTLTVQSMLNTLISQPEISAAHVISSSVGTLISAGLPLHSTEKQQIKNALKHPQTTTISLHETGLFITPLTLKSGNIQPIPQWLVVKWYSPELAIVKYQGIIITLVCTIFIGILAVFLANRVSKTLSDPLKTLEQGVNRFVDGDFSHTIELQPKSEFSALTDTLNQAASNFHHSQQEMQNFIEQSTDDLRETLETIEIQNIELDLARKDALEASRIKSEFLANTSHEIRTPLNSIIGFTSLLLKSELTTHQQNQLRIIEGSSQHLLSVINDILDFSRIEAGKLMLDCVPLELREVIEQTLIKLTPPADEKQLQLITLIEHNTPLNLLGDPLRLKQILTNLISNAIKFSNKGNIIVRVTSLKISELQVTLKICVSDTGIGLSDKQQELLFSAFSQADNSSSRKYGGTGLGLAISKGIIERMGGSIGVESEEGKGATFWFTAKMGIDPSEASPVTCDALSDLSIVLYHTNPISQLQLNEYMESWQVKTIELDNFHDILPAVKHENETGNHIRIVVMEYSFSDSTMEIETMCSLIRQLEQHFDCKVIIIAATQQAKTIATDIESTSATVITKPLLYRQFYQALCALLDIEQSHIAPEKRKTQNRPASVPVMTPTVDSVNNTRQNRNTSDKTVVMVVDDTPSNLQLVGEILVGLQVEVILANSGANALKHFEQETIDLIFMDIQMPDMDGMETTKRIRRLESGHNRTPIIALTAHTITEQRAHILLAGIDDYLGKPATDIDLAHMINRWVPSSKSIALPNTPEPVREVNSDISAIKKKPKNNQEDDISQSVDTDKDNGISRVDESLSIVDTEKSLRLSNRNTELAQDMLRMLIDSLPSTEQEIDTALESNDPIMLAELAHKLHGGCCYCGVPRLEQASANLEKLLQYNALKDCQSGISILKSEITRLKKWAEKNNLENLFTEENTSMT